MITTLHFNYLIERIKMENLTNPTLLSDMILDYQIFKLNWYWESEEYIWQRWIRSEK